MSEVTGKRDEQLKILPDATPQDDLTRARRRRLLIGAAAIPTVYTLTSGAAVAAASLNCWSRPAGTAVPQRVTAGPDQWARAPMKSGKVKITGPEPTAYCMKDPAKQSECVDPLQPDTSAAQTYWYVQGQKTLEAQGGIWKIPQSPGYGLLYVDQTGTIQSFDPQAYPGIELKYASTSCMQSISPTAKSMLG